MNKLSDYFTKESVRIDVEAANAEAAIRSCGTLLLKAGKIEPSYIEAMIDVYHKLGPYIVIAPGIAFPHAKPGPEVKEPCIAFCRLKRPVRFGHPQNDPVRYLFALGGVNETDHIGMLRLLSGFLMKDSNLEALALVKDEIEFMDLLGKEV